MERPVLGTWLEMVMEQSGPGVRDVARSVGEPVYGTAGPGATGGRLCGWRGGDGRYLSLRFDSDTAGTVEVTTGTHPLGGTDILVQELLGRATRDVGVPFKLSVAERLVMLSVADVRTQFRAVEASNGHWIAAGGLGKRHLRLIGSPGTVLDDIELTEVVLP